LSPYLCLLPYSTLFRSRSNDGRCILGRSVPGNGTHASVFTVYFYRSGSERSEWDRCSSWDIYPVYITRYFDITSVDAAGMAMDGNHDCTCYIDSQRSEEHTS